MQGCGVCWWELGGYEGGDVGAGGGGEVGVDVCGVGDINGGGRGRVGKRGLHGRES